MQIAEQDLAAIRAFGYSDDQAHFLYLVAAYLGYFVLRQFLNLSGANWGRRTDKFTKKLESRGHADRREYYRTGGVYHVFSKALYAKTGKKNLLNRRHHSLAFIRT
jgi:hypothetical protein